MVPESTIIIKLRRDARILKARDPITDHSHGQALAKSILMAHFTKQIPAHSSELYSKIFEKTADSLSCLKSGIKKIPSQSKFCTYGKEAQKNISGLRNR